MPLTTDYKQLLDSLTTAVVLLNDSFQVIDINTAAESLLEVSSKQVANTTLNRYFHESADALEKLRDAVKDMSQYTKRKARWRLHSGKSITVDYTVTPLNERGQVLLEIQPLDRLLRISREETLLASQETTKNLMRGLAHEVKNPLGGIRGAAQLLDRELDTEELKEYTHIIIAESDRLRNLVDRMLGPQQRLELKPTNVHEVLERVIALMKAETAGQIAFVRDYDPSIPEIPGDSEMLIQAVLNIVSNAMQALLEQAHNASPAITLGTRIYRQFTIGRRHYPLVANINIEDNGPGIPQKIIDNIFYPMISGRAEGTGLGLSISQQLITQHRGLIECSSERGRTLFSIYLPLDMTND
ncbi:MAG: two-component system nitrogen regulation sensor histidine kinase GlnL [Kiritimatiellia bacterium]|jgi:two-component system nitrogen regulation sensor histidine kinase GlnL